MFSVGPAFFGWKIFLGEGRRAEGKLENVNLKFEKFLSVDMGRTKSLTHQSFNHSMILLKLGNRRAGCVVCVGWE
jgi:hypothetical protein